VAAVHRRQHAPFRHAESERLQGGGEQAIAPPEHLGQPEENVPLELEILERGRAIRSRQGHGPSRSLAAAAYADRLGWVSQLRLGSAHWRRR